MDDKDKLIKQMEDSAIRNDKINQRLTQLVAIVVITFGIVCIAVPFMYFTADYYYPSVQTTDSTNTTNTVGGE